MKRHKRRRAKARHETRPRGLLALREKTPYRLCRKRIRILEPQTESRHSHKGELKARVEQRFRSKQQVHDRADRESTKKVSLAAKKVGREHQHRHQNRPDHRRTQAGRHCVKREEQRQEQELRGPGNRHNAERAHQAHRQNHHMKARNGDDVSQARAGEGGLNPIIQSGVDIEAKRIHGLCPLFRQAAVGKPNERVPNSCGRAQNGRPGFDNFDGLRLYRSHLRRTEKSTSKRPNRSAGPDAKK